MLSTDRQNSTRAGSKVVAIGMYHFSVLYMSGASIHAGYEGLRKSLRRQQSNCTLVKVNDDRCVVALECPTKSILTLDFGCMFALLSHLMLDFLT